ncbi:MAG: SDR family NAD(P)-dependent oxidoreductase [Fibrobacterota bacterium]
MKIALITGASAGLGRDFVRQLDTAGLDELWIIARRTDRLEQIKSESSTPCRVIPCDLLNPDEIDTGITALLQEHRPAVHWCINNAGFGKVGPFAEIDLSAQSDMVRLNCNGVLHVTHAVLPFMPAESHLINISSAASFGPLGGFAVYGATKAFVTSFTYALRAELQERRIFCTAVCPGPTETEFSRVARAGSVAPDSIFSKKYRSKDVVRRALRDSRKNRAISVFGAKERFLRVFSAFLPDSTIARLSWKKIMQKRY